MGSFFSSPLSQQPPYVFDLTKAEREEGQSLNQPSSLESRPGLVEYFLLLFIILRCFPNLLISKSLEIDELISTVHQLKPKARASIPRENIKPTFLFVC